MHHLAHEEKSRQLVLIGRLSKIILEKASFLGVGVNNKVRDDRQVEIAIVHESSLPVHEPDAAAVEQDVFRLQVHVARHQIRIEARVNGADLLVAVEDLLDLTVREQSRPAKSPNEKVVRPLAAGLLPVNRRIRLLFLWG